MKNVPVPLLLAIAATLYGSNLLLLIVNKAGECPFLSRMGAVVAGGSAFCCLVFVRRVLVGIDLCVGGSDP